MTTRKLVKTSFIITITFLTFLSIVALPAKHSFGDDSKTVPEYLVIAGYLYKFFHFFEWPPPSFETEKENNTISIGILGEDPFKDYFAPIEGQIIKPMGKKITIKRFGPYRNNLKLDECEILFISRSEKSNLKKILNQIEGHAILTVGYMEGFSDAGGMINLIDIGGLLRWEINLFSIENSDLKVSSNIVQSAVRVIKIVTN